MNRPDCIATSPLFMPEGLCFEDTRAFVVKLVQHLCQPFLMAGRIRLQDHLDSGSQLRRFPRSDRGMAERTVVGYLGDFRSAT